VSWVILDDDFPNHPKTVQAGNDAALLFVFGLCYCRKYHTGGFIPSDACYSLGFKGNPRKAVEALLAAGYWERAVGGFQVHEYAKRYDDEKAKATKEKRQEAGRKGGLESGRVRQGKQTEASASSFASDVASPPLDGVLEPLRDGTDRSSSLVLQKVEETDKGDPSCRAEWWAETLEMYPQNRVMHGFMTQSLFVEIFDRDKRPDADVWKEFRSKLEANKRSHEWRVKGMVPKLENYLRNGWKQVHDEYPPSALVGQKSSRTLTAVSAIVKAGKA
jgi:general stress protein YciG